MKARILQIAAFAIGIGIIVMVIWFMTNKAKTGTEKVLESSTEPGKTNPGQMTEPYRPTPKSSVPGVAQDAKN